MSDNIYIGEAPDCEYDKDKIERARKTTAFCIGESSQHYDSLRRAFDDFYDRWTNQPLKLRQTNRIRSNVPSGIVPEMIDSIKADMMDKITKKRPYIPTVAREEGDFDSARLVEALIQFDWDQIGFWFKGDSNLTSACLYGSGLSKMVFETRVVKGVVKGVNGQNGRPMMEDVIGYQGPNIIDAFIYDVYPSPQKVHVDDPHPITHVTYGSYDDLEELAEIGVYDMAQVKKIPDRDFYSKYDDMAEYAPFNTSDPFQRSDQRARMGWTTDNRLQPDGIMICETECMFRHNLKDPPVRTIITIANGVVIGIRPTPLGSGDSVWLNGKILNIPGQFYGMSLVQKNKPQVHVTEVTLNMGLQNLAIAVNRQKIIRPDLVMNPSSFDDTPNGNIFAKPNATNLDQVVKPIDPVSVAQDVFAFMNWGQSRAEGVSANTELKSGRMPSGERTATASNLAFTQASVRFKYMLKTFSESFLIPASQKMLSYNRDYLSEEYVFKIVGKSGTAWKSVTQSDLAINVDFVFLGADREDNEALAIAQLENMLKIVSPLAQSPKMTPVIEQIVVLLADKLDFPDMEKLKQLMGFGQMPTEGLIPTEGPSAGTPNGPSRRQDRRIGQPNGAPTNMTAVAKQVGALLGRGGGGVRA